MVSFGFKRSCPSVKSPSAAYPTALIPIEVGQRYETDGAALRKRGGALTTEALKVPHFPSKPRPTCVVIAPHFRSESVPHFARNPQHCHEHRVLLVSITSNKLFHTRCNKSFSMDMLGSLPRAPRTAALS